MKTLTVLLDANLYDLDDIAGLVAVVLTLAIPILIAAFTYRRKLNETNKRAQVVLAAIEKGTGEMPEELLKSLNKPQKSLKQQLLDKLMWGILCSVAGVGVAIAAVIEYYYGEEGYPFDADYLILSALLLAVGIGFLVYYFVGRRMLSKEIEAEANMAKKENEHVE